jgi:hypothetical protein
MDAAQGAQEDPLSLHKYTYAQCDPVNFIDPSGFGRMGHHVICRAIWEDRKGRTSLYTGVAKAFFNNPAKEIGAIIPTPNGHDMSAHGGYSAHVDELVVKWHRKTKIPPWAMKAEDCEELLKFVKKDKFVDGFNLKVPEGKKAVIEWVKDKGWKKLPPHLQNRARKGAEALFERFGKGALRKVNIAITVGIILVKAEHYASAGIPKEEIAHEVAHDFLDSVSYGGLDLANSAIDSMIEHAHWVAEQAAHGAFSYLWYDPETSDYQGGGISSAEFYDAAQKRVDSGGEEMHAGDSVGW